MTPHKSTTPQQPTLSDRLAYLALIIIEKVLGALPCYFVWKMGSHVGQLIMLFSNKRRSIVFHNLKLVHPDASDSDIANRSKKVFLHSFGNLFASLKTCTISSNQIEEFLETEDFHRLNELSSDQGAILLLLHMGNWEILTKLTALLPENKKLGGMYRPLKNPLMDKHIRAKREADGSELFMKKRGVIKANKHIKNGGILGILADQSAGKAGLSIPLFGKKTSITQLPAILALKHNCPIFPVSVVTTTPGRWKMHVHSPLLFSKATTKEAATCEIASTMEKLMKAHSRDVFWLHDRWKIIPKKRR